MTRLTSWLTALTLSLAFGPVLAEEAQTERAEMAALETAAQHAGLAARAATVEETHQHLQHTLNCLVGPDDEAYNEQAGNPCEAQGGSVIQGFESSEATVDEAIPEVLEQAKELAEAGTEQQRYIGATAAAHGVSGLLESLQQEVRDAQRAQQ